MTNYQIYLLNKLYDLLMEICKEAQNEDFNMILADLDIFQLSIDDAASKILYLIEEHK